MKPGLDAISSLLSIKNKKKAGAKGKPVWSSGYIEVENSQTGE
jgi:hypothetical protein